MQRLVLVILFLSAAALAAASVARPNDHRNDAIPPQQHPVLTRLSSELLDIRALMDDRRSQAEIGLEAVIATLDSDLTYTRAYNHLRADVAEILLSCGEINRANAQLGKGIAASEETLRYIDAILDSKMDPPAGYSRHTIRSIREQEIAKVKELLKALEHYHKAAAESRDRVETIRLADDTFDPVFTRFVRRHEQAIRNYALTSHTQSYEFPAGDLIVAAKAGFQAKNILVLIYHVFMANELAVDQLSITAGPVMISRIPEPGARSFYEFSAVQATPAEH